MLRQIILAVSFLLASLSSAWAAFDLSGTRYGAAIGISTLGAQLEGRAHVEDFVFRLGFNRLCFSKGDVAKSYDIITTANVSTRLQSAYLKADCFLSDVFYASGGLLLNGDRLVFDVQEKTPTTAAEFSVKLQRKHFVNPYLGIGLAYEKNGFGIDLGLGASYTGKIIVNVSIDETNTSTSELAIARDVLEHTIKPKVQDVVNMLGLGEFWPVFGLKLFYLFN